MGLKHLFHRATHGGIVSSKVIATVAPFAAPYTSSGRKALAGSVWGKAAVGASGYFGGGAATPFVSGVVDHFAGNDAPGFGQLPQSPYGSDSGGGGGGGYYAASDRASGSSNTTVIIAVVAGVVVLAALAFTVARRK